MASNTPPPPPSGPAPASSYVSGLTNQVRRRGKAGATKGFTGEITADSSANAKDGGVLESPRNPWYCVCALHMTPPWLRENDYILSGYRAPMPSKRFALRSIFGWHNETVNIWTHLVGFMFFVALTVYFALSTGQMKAPALPAYLNTPFEKVDMHALREVLRKRLPELVGGGESLYNITGLHALRDRLRLFEVGVETKAHKVVGGMTNIVLPLKDRFLEVSAVAELLMHDNELTHKIIEYVREHLQPEDMAARWPLYVFLGGAMVCLLASTLCHTFHCISPEFSAFLWRFDYAGIVCLISTSFFPVVFYTFQCLPFWRLFYLVSILILGISCILVSCLETFQDPKYQPLRAYMFAGLGLVGIVPVGHQFLFTWRAMPPPVMAAIAYEVLMGASYLSGTALFVLRVPERWYPGRFDLWLHSHNIFHVLVFAGACIHYKASMVLLQWRDHTSCAVDGHMLQQFYLE